MDFKFDRLCFSRSICFSISILISLVFLSPIKAQVIEIEIGNIKELSEEYSLQWQQFENRFNYMSYGERAQVTPLNPSISYDLEFLDNGSQSEYEQYLYLQKEIRTPGHFRNLRERRDTRIRLFDYQADGDRHEWLAATRLGFIRILLAQREVEILENLKSRISRISDASLRRAEAGEVSLLDDQLIQMSNYQLQARIEERRIEADRLAMLWRNRMGFDEHAELYFKGEFESLNVVLPDNSELFQFLDRSPQSLALQQAVDAAILEESIARSNRIPSFDLSAGYKQLNPNWRGFLFGISIPLPILSSNSESISQARALQGIEQANLDYAQSERKQITFQLLGELDSYEYRLNQFPEYLNNKDPFLNRLIISYEEGTLSVSDFLNTLNLIADTFQTRFNQLTNYYGIVTELEALTGQEFIIQN